MKKILTLPLLLLMVVACTTEKNGDQSETTAEATPDADDWIYLFDGSSTEGWPTYNGDALPPGWASVYT